MRRAAGADHPGADLAGQLHRKRSNTAGRAVDHDGLAGLESAVDEESLPCRET